MPLRQTIGISLALLMASAGAMAETPEKSTSHHTGPSSNPDPETSPALSVKTGVAPMRSRALSRPTSDRGERNSYRQAASYHTTAPRSGAAGSPQIGQAAWYDLVGGRTANGERLDTITLTAAHRSLPLGSCAKVISLDTGRSVVVKINDRGPYNRRFIIDLSPRAANELGMRHAGVAAVAVEPLAVAPLDNAARPTLAAYRATGVNVTQ